MLFFSASHKYNKTFIVSKDVNNNEKKKILDYLQNRFAHTNISIQIK